MTRKVEVQVFSQTTAPPRYHSIPVWQIAGVLFALGLAIVGFLVFDARSILKKWSDVSLFRLYSQNKELQKTVNLLQDQTESAHLKLAHMDSLRQVVAVSAGIPSAGIETPTQEEEEAPVRLGSIGPAKNMNRIRDAHRKFRHLLSELELNPQYARTLPLIHPLRNHSMVTGRFQMVSDPNTGFEVAHRGIDWATHEGDTVIAPGAGLVASIQNEKGFGTTITLMHNERVETFYAHLNRALVRPGQNISRGTPLALVGSTGRTAGPHLHYEVHFMGQPVNPEDYFLSP